MTPTRPLAAMGFALVCVAGACKIGNSDNNSGDAADFKQQLSQSFSTNNINGFSNAIHRLLLAATGQAQTGVTLTPITGGVQGSVGVDVDGNGSLETSVNGKLIYLNPATGIAGGANFTLTGITGGAPQTATGSAVIAETAPSVVTISNGTFETHTQTRGNDLSLSSVNLTTDIGGGAYKVTGTADFDFNGLNGRLTFQPSGSEFKIVVSGSGFTTFTIP